LSGAAWARRHGNIAIANGAYCWVKNVEAAWAVGSDIGFYSTCRNVLRDSYVHETPDPNPGGGGYLLTITNGASENLIENNILWYGNKVITMRGSGGGNVVAYNYTDDTFDSTNPQSPEAGLNAGHYTTPHLELLEGNYGHNFKGDTYRGNSIHITVFRNHLSGLRASHPPLKAYSFSLQCGPLPMATTGRTAVDVPGIQLHQKLCRQRAGHRRTGSSLMAVDGASMARRSCSPRRLPQAQFDAADSQKRGRHRVVWLVSGDGEQHRQLDVRRLDHQHTDPQW
jgi:hypothetical protein